MTNTEKPSWFYKDKQILNFHCSLFMLINHLENSQNRQFSEDPVSFIPCIMESIFKMRRIEFLIFFFVLI